MEYWQEHINYRQVKRPDGTVRYLITIDNQDVEVDEALYHEYTRMERRERYLAEQETGRRLSWELLVESESAGDLAMQLATESTETMVLEDMRAQENSQLLELLPQALARLDAVEERIIRALYLDGRSERDVARELGVSQPAIHKRQVRILRKLMDLLNK